MGLRVFSYGGGVQSTAALVLAAQGKIDFPTFLFANVGDDSEHPATLRYVREEMRWQGNDATWARGVVEKEQLLNELVRQQCERWAGRPVANAR